jgi:hypothetical protein
MRMIISPYFLQLARLGDAALVRPQDGGADHRVVRIGQHRNMGTAAEPNGGNVTRGDTGPPNGLRYRLAEGGIPFVRILFRPAGMRDPGLDRVRGFAGETAVAANDRGLGYRSDRRPSNGWGADSQFALGACLCPCAASLLKAW